MADVRTQILEVVRPLLELADEYEICEDPYDDRWERKFHALVMKIAADTGLYKEEIDALFFDYIEMRNITDHILCPEAC